MSAVPHPHQPTVLLTGFAPFAGESVNPSWEAVRALQGRVLDGYRIESAMLPCEFGAAPPVLRHALRKFKPHAVIAVGLAGGRDGISLERVAINVVDARIPDNAGRQPIDVPIVRSGPVGYFSRLPLKAALAALQAAGIPAHVSQTAGTYVCNQVFYTLLHATRRNRQSRVGFVHVPWLPEQAAAHAQPGMPLAQTVEALALIVHTTLTTHHDIRAAAGAES